MKRKLLLPIFFLFFIQSINAQKKQNEGTFYLYDTAWKQVQELKDAFYFLNVRKLDDTTWRHDYYYVAGPRKMSETYKDEDGTKLNGLLAWYNAEGYLDSSGFAQDGKKHSDWTYYEPGTGKARFLKYYENGVLKKERDYSIRILAPEHDMNKYEECTFKGNFKNFLEKNLVFPERAMNMRYGSVVNIDFIVDKEGKITDPQVMRSLEFSLDREAERVILLSSGRWKPGKINGQIVKSFHRQSINFDISEEE